MGQHGDVQRLERDLATLREAVGGELPFGRADVWMNLALVPGGLFMLAWGSLTAPGYRWVAAAPIGIALLGAAYLRYACRRSTGRSGIRRREYSLNLLLALVLLMGAILYWWWAGRFGFSRSTVAMAAVFFAGLCASVLGLMDRVRRYQLGSGIPLIALALALPALPTYRTAMLGVGTAVATAGLWTAAIQWVQLRGTERA